MSSDKPPDTRKDSDEFARAAGEARPSILAEFWDFLKYNKKWWLLPILLAILGMGIIIAIGGTGAAPFIYPFF